MDYDLEMFVQPEHSNLIQLPLLPTSSLPPTPPKQPLASPPNDRKTNNDNGKFSFFNQKLIIEVGISQVQ